jgi:hypothetical protein
MVGEPADPNTGAPATGQAGDIAALTALAVPYWYRGILTRQDSNFDQAAAPVDMPGTDPSLNPDYTLQSTPTTDLGGGIIERTLNFSATAGPVQLEETPLEGTLVVFNGTVPVSAALYSVVRNKITFTGAHRGADGDHDPLPDLGLCARRESGFAAGDCL